MDYFKIAESIQKSINNHPFDRTAYNDMLSLCRSWEKEDLRASHAMSAWLRDKSKIILAECNPKEAEFFFGIYKKTLLFDAPHDFDSFLLYMEIDRKPSKKFYAPRRHYLKPIVQGYQDIIDGKLRLLTVSLPKRAGKLIAHDTPVLTTHGFKKHGELKPGDYVYGLEGKPVKVIYKHPDSYAVYRVKFSSGEEILTSAEHEWIVYDKTKGKKRIVETQEMLREGLRRDNRWSFLLPRPFPVDMPHKCLPVEPYSLGAWLGDGTTSKPVMTNDKKDLNIISRMESDGYCVGNQFVDKNYGTIVTQFTRDFTSALRSVGMCFRDSKGNKHIPETYFTANISQRLQLLAGLIDADGFVEKNKHRVAISTVLPRLRDDIIRLVSTFGWDCRYYTEKAKTSSSGIVGRKDVYTVTFTPDRDIPTVLPRKKISPTKIPRRISVRSIEPLDQPVVGNCITVEGGLYRVGYRQVITHNSQLGINFINFLSGRRPDRASLMEGTGDDLVKSFYKGCLEYLQEPNEYLFYDVFPNARIVQTNADNKTINLESKSRFPTIMCRSIDARQVGLSEATNVLYLDDCVEGREEAKNRQRLEDKWEIISGDIMGRAIEGAPMVFTGTRYSIYDPIGKIQEYAKSQNWEWRAIEIPALDPDTDESNYEYVREGKKVFTTAYFREQRDLLSQEQFESEFQQMPFEAKGLLFNKDDLNYYYELPPDRMPDAVVAFADTAESGSDYVSMPVGYIYGDDVMIEDVVFDDSTADVTKPQCANVIKRNGVSMAVFESNNAGEYYAKDIAEILKGMGYKCSIRTRRTVSNKLTRIEFAADGIKKNFWFKHPSTYEKKSQYAEFMKNVTTFTRTGKVAHDDGPDSLAMMENGIRNIKGGGVEVLRRPV